MKSNNLIGIDMESNNNESQIKRLTEENGQYVLRPIPKDDPFFQTSLTVNENGSFFGDPDLDVFPGLRIECEWNDSIIPILEELSVNYLVLNTSYGWKCNDYSFLSRIPLIKKIFILSGAIKNIHHIESQNELEEITIHGHIIENHPIDFCSFPKLKRLFLSGDQVNVSLFSCIGLTTLWIDELWEKDNIFIERLINLRELTIKNSSISDLSFLASLPELTKLSLDNCRSIRDYETIPIMPQLCWLSLRGVVVRNLEFLRHTQNLRILVIQTGMVESIRPIENLKNLKAFGLGGSILDKDLTPINSLPVLSMLWVNNKRDYPYKVNNHWDWNDYGSFHHEWLTPR